MAQYQITSWRDLPSMVAARAGDEVTKVQLAPRFQEAIDEAAMRLGDTGSDDYLAGWTRTPWTSSELGHAEAAELIARQLEDEWTESRISEYLDSLG